MRKTLEELRKENMLLKKRSESKSKFLKSEIERRELMSENRKLRYPKTFNTVSTLGKVVKTGVTAAGIGLMKAGKSAQEYERRDRAIQKRKGNKRRSLI